MGTQRQALPIFSQNANVLQHLSSNQLPSFNQMGGLSSFGLAQKDSHTGPADSPSKAQTRDESQYVFYESTSKLISLKRFSEELYE